MYPGKNLSEQSREPTNSTYISQRVKKSNPSHVSGRRVQCFSLFSEDHSFKRCFSKSVWTVSNYRLRNNSQLDLVKGSFKLCLTMF